MKRILPLLFLLFHLFNYSSFAQTDRQIPNGGFEEWEERLIYRTPQGWTISYDTLTSLRSDDAYSGQYSLKLKSVIEQRDTDNRVDFGFAFYGQEGDNEFPEPRSWYNTTDKFKFRVKYNIAPDDAGIAYLQINSGGEPVFSDVIVFTGESNSWELFEINLGNQGDGIEAEELLIVFLPSSPFDEENQFGFPTSYTPSDGSWLMIDDLVFELNGSDIADYAINGDFELWDDITVYDPVGWTSTNIYLSPEGNTNVFRSTDSYTGNYAVKLETVADIWNTNYTQQAVLSLGNELWSDGGIPYTHRPRFISGVYKYSSSYPNAIIDLSFYANGNRIGENNIFLPPTNNYTRFIGWQNQFWSQENPDLLMVDISSGNELGSVLFLDDLGFLSEYPVNFFITDSWGNPVGNATITIAGIDPLFLGNPPQINMNQNAQYGLSLPDGYYTYAINAPGFKPVSDVHFNVTGRVTDINQTLESESSQPGSNTFSSNDNDVDYIYFPGNNFSVTLHNPDLPNGVTPGITGGILDFHNNFVPIQLFVDNTIEATTINSNSFNISGTITDDLPFGVIAFRLELEYPSIGIIETEPIPVIFPEYNPRGGSNYGLALTGANIPEGDIYSVPGLSEFSNLYDIEKDISFVKNTLGSITFAQGLNIVDNLHQLADIQHAMNISSDNEAGTYLAEINPQLIPFLTHSGATITIENYLNPNFTIRKSSYGQNADYNMPEDHTANSTAVLSGNILEFYVDGFSRYTALGLQTFNLILEAEPLIGGTVEDLTDEAPYLPGTLIDVKATAADGYQFLNWRKDGAEVVADAEFNYVMPSQDVTLVAHFIESGTEIHNLHIEIDPPIAGYASGSGTYTEGESITLEAIPYQGFVFTGWEDQQGVPIDINGDQFTMPGSDITIVAKFREFINATVTPESFQFIDFEDVSKFEIVITWNDANYVSRVYAYSDDINMDLWFETDYIDDGSSLLTIYTGDKGISGENNDGEYLINMVIEFDSGDPAQIPVIFTDPTWEFRITVKDVHTWQELQNVTLNISDGINQFIFHTDNNGYLRGSLPSGNYFVDIELFGYISESNLNLTIEPGFAENNYQFLLMRDYTVFATVNSSTPFNAENNVCIHTNIEITFERDIQENIYSGGFNNIMLTNQWGQRVNTEFIEIQEGNVLFIKPYDKLEFNTSYNLFIPEYSISDAENINVGLSNDFFLNFTTEQFIEARVVPEQMTFSLNEPEDVIFTIEWGSDTELLEVNRLEYDQSINNYMPYPIDPVTDYIVEGDLLIIKTAYILADNPEPMDMLRFNAGFLSGHSYFEILIVEDDQPKLHPSYLEYDLDNRSDLLTIFTPAGHGTIESVTNIDSPLTAGEDFEVAGPYLIISNDYLSTKLLTIGEELLLTVGTSTGVQIELTIASISSGIINAVINPSEIEAFNHEMPEYIETIITWNDASEVTGMVVSMIFEYGLETMPYENFEIIDDNGTTATLRIYVGEENSTNSVTTEKDNSKAFDYFFVAIEIAFNEGAPATLLFTIIDEFYFVNVNINPYFAGYVSYDHEYNPGETVTLEAVPNPGFVFDSWRANGSVVSRNNPYSFVMPSNDVNLTAHFSELFVKVVETSPAQGEPDVPVTSDIVVTFERGVRHGQSPQGLYDINLRDQFNNQWQIENISIVNSNQILIKVLGSLSYSTSYTLTIPQRAVADQEFDWVAMQTDYILNFTTESFVPPTVEPERGIYSLANPNIVEFEINFGSDTEIEGLFMFSYNETTEEYIPHELTHGDDYVISGNSLTVLSEFIESLNPEINDRITFGLQFMSGWTSWFEIMVVGDTNPSLLKTSLTFDLNNPKDLFTGVTYASAGKIVSIELTETPLINETDFSVTGPWIFIYKDYIASHLTAIDQQIELTVIFESGFDLKLTIIAVSTAVTDAVITPEFITYNPVDDADFADIDITWNDASEVTGVNITMYDEWGFETEPYNNFEIVEDNGEVAKMRIYFGEPDGGDPTKSGSKAVEYFYVDAEISFDTGSPAYLFITVEGEYYNVNVTTDPLHSGWIEGAHNYIPGQTVTLTAHVNYGFLFEGWKSNGVTVSMENPYVFTMPREDVNLEAKFTPVFVKVIDSDPIQNSSGVPVNTDIVLTFEREIAIGSTPNGLWDIKLESQFGVIEPLQSVEIIQGNKVLAIELSETWNLSYGTRYTLTIPANALTDREFGGRYLENDYKLSFTTEEYFFAEINPETAIFSLTNPEDVEFTINWGSETAINKLEFYQYDPENDTYYSPVVMVRDVDWTLDNDKLTIYSSFITNLDPDIFDMLSFSVDFFNSWVWFDIFIVGDTNPTLQPDKLNYDLDNKGNIFTSVVYGSADEVTGINNGLLTLTEDVDYIVNGPWIHLLESYLNSELTNVDDVIELNVMFDTGVELDLMVTAIQSGITNATITPGAIDYNINNGDPYVDITITWNDASVVEGMVVYMYDEWGIESMPYDDWTILADDGISATLRIIMGNEDDAKGVNSWFNDTKAVEYFYVVAEITFDVGAPAHLFISAFEEYYNVFLTADPNYGGWVAGDYEYYPGETVELRAFPYPGYLFHSWQANDEVVSSENPYIFSMPSEDVVLTARFYEEGTVPYTVTFSVTGQTAQPFENAEIEISGISGVIETKHTGSDGKAKFTLTSGNYTFTIRAEDHNDYIGEFIVEDSDLSVPITLMYVGINEPETLQEVKVYPNPNDGLFYLEYSTIGNSNIVVEIISLTGNKIFVEEFPSGYGRLETIDIRHVSRGIYFLIVKENNKTNTIKMIIR